ncbi:T-cell surface glycoprotein CD8 alpha chain, partial [Mesitornis unicolor]
SSITHPKMGQQLELECVIPEDDSGVFWFRQDKGGILHFINFTNSLSRNTFVGNAKESTHFEASRDSKFYWLVVKSFTSKDEGTYFCFMNRNKELYFSPGQPAFIPVTTTQAPTTQRNSTKEDPCLKTPETTKDKELNFCCDIFIWVLLALACLLLIIALAVTVVLRQR